MDDVKIANTLKEKAEQAKKRKNGKITPLTSKKKRRFSKIRNAVRKKTDVEYIKK